MIDDGAAGIFTQSGDVLTSSTFKVDVTSLPIGLEYRFKVISSNHIDSKDSNIVKATVADVPAAPLNAP